MLEEKVMTTLKKLDLPEDSEHGYIEDVQTLTNKFTEKMEEIGKKKIEEIMVI